MPFVLCTNPFISVRWVVANRSALLFRISFKTAQARAAPSSGSVPVPSSSMRTSDFALAFFSISEMFEICAENVERLFSIDCSSPISISRSCTRGKLDEGSAGTGIPDKAMSRRSPIVLIAMVFPPAFEPVITITVSVPPRCRSRGTTS